MRWTGRSWTGASPARVGVVKADDVDTKIGAACDRRA